MLFATIAGFMEETLQNEKFTYFDPKLNCTLQVV